MLVPGRERRLASSRLLGLGIPAAALVLGVALARVSGGAGFLAAVASVATPVLAAGAGWTRGSPAPWLVPPLVGGLYVLAWLEPHALAGEAAGVLLIAGACLTATGVVAALAPRAWLVAGLVVLVTLDCVLVWGDRQVGPTMTALEAAVPPAAGGRPLPSLQQATFGDATMGWLDLAAPALLALLVRRRAAAALATGLTAGAWGLLLAVTSPIAATPPVLAGLAASGRRPRRAGSPPSPPASSSAPPAAGTRRRSAGTSRR